MKKLKIEGYTGKVYYPNWMRFDDYSKMSIANSNSSDPTYLTIELPVWLGNLIKETVADAKEAGKKELADQFKALIGVRQ